MSFTEPKAPESMVHNGRTEMPPGKEDSLSDALSPNNSEKPGDMAFPEGGLRAWLVACGAGGVLFCTFGYANAFG